MPVVIIESVTGKKYGSGDGHYFRLSQKLNNKLYLNCHLRSCRVRGIYIPSFTFSIKFGIRILVDTRSCHPRAIALSCPRFQPTCPSIFRPKMTASVAGERITIRRTSTKRNSVWPRSKFWREPPEIRNRCAKYSRKKRPRTYASFVKTARKLRAVTFRFLSSLSPKTIRRLNYPSFVRRMQRRRQLDVHLVPDSLDDFAERMDSEEYRDFAYIGSSKFFIGSVENQAILFISPTLRE